MSKTDMSHKTPGRAKATSLVAWSDVSAEERGVLARVEAEVLDAPEAARDEVALSATRGRSWGWAFAGALGIACVAFLVWPGAASIPALQAEGHLKFQPATRAGQGAEAVLQQGAQLRDPQGWSLEAHGESQLQVQRKGARHTRLHLARGAVTIYVKPGSMREFVVACAGGIKVVVTGTKFLVWQGKERLRVEVLRGHVMLRRGKQPLLHLYKGQGVRLQSKAAGPTRTYQLPTKAKGWNAKVERLARQQPDELLAYVYDLQADKLLTKERRLLALETAAHAFEGAKRWETASRLWLRIFKLQPKGYEAQSALFQAARSCRLGAANASRCARIYQTFLRQFPKSLPSFREEVMFWAGALRPSQALGDAAKRTSQRLLQDYLDRYPRGRYATKAKQLLAKP